MVQLIILIIIVIFLSGIFSSLEAALFAVPQSRVELFKSQKKAGAKSLYNIKKRVSRTIIVLVIGNNITNIAGSIFVGAIAADVLGHQLLGVISGVLTFLIIIFGEIIPKTIGENYSDKIALFVAPFLWTMTKVFTPVIWFLELFTKHFIRPHTIVSEEEIKIMSHIGLLHGSIEKDEQEMIKNTFALNDIEARDIMTTRDEMECLEIDEIVGKIEEKIYETSFPSRLPVYKNSLDNIKGVVQWQDLITALARDEKKKTVGDFINKPLFVLPTMKADDLLPLFQRKKTHMAIVRDNNDKVLGLVTLEDVLEQLVGDITDETDED